MKRPVHQGAFLLRASRKSARISAAAAASIPVRPPASRSSRPRRPRSAFRPRTRRARPGAGQPARVTAGPAGLGSLRLPAPAPMRPPTACRPGHRPPAPGRTNPAMAAKSSARVVMPADDGQRRRQQSGFVADRHADPRLAQVERQQAARGQIKGDARMRHQPLLLHGQSGGLVPVHDDPDAPGQRRQVDRDHVGQPIRAEGNLGHLRQAEAFAQDAGRLFRVHAQHRVDAPRWHRRAAAPCPLR